MTNEQIKITEQEMQELEKEIEKSMRPVMICICISLLALALLGAIIIATLKG